MNPALNKRLLNFRKKEKKEEKTEYFQAKNINI